MRWQTVGMLSLLAERKKTQAMQEMQSKLAASEDARKALLARYLTLHMACFESWCQGNVMYAVPVCIPASSNCAKFIFLEASTSLLLLWSTASNIYGMRWCVHAL